MKLKLEEEKEKIKNITGYYEEIIQGYEDKLAVEKLKNSVLIAIAQLDDTDWWTKTFLHDTIYYIFYMPKLNMRKN